MPSLLSTLNSLLCGAFVTLSFVSQPTEGLFSDDISECRRKTIAVYRSLTKAMNGTHFLSEPQHELRRWVDSIRIECVQMAIWKECPATQGICKLSGHRIGSDLLSGVTFRNENATGTGIIPLKTLYLNGCGLSDLSGIRFPRTLQTIYLEHNAIVHLGGSLANLTAVNALHLTDNRLTSQNIDGELPLNLGVLLLSKNFISDLRGIRSPGGNLKFLDLKDNQITDSDLKQMNWTAFPRLRQLYLKRNRIVNLSDVSFPRTLHGIYLADNHIVHLGGSLAHLTNVQSIQLSNNRLTVQNIDGELPVNNLKALYLSNNNISDLSGFPLLDTLTTLHLADNQITDTDLKQMNWNAVPRLDDLSLKNNFIANLSGVTFPNSIVWLKLDDNSIIELGDSLVNVKGLESLNLNGNRLSTHAIAGKLPLWTTDLHLNGNCFADLKALQLHRMGRLETIHLVRDNSVTDLRDVEFPESTRFIYVSSELTNLNGFRVPDGLKRLSIMFPATPHSEAKCTDWTAIDLKDMCREGADLNVLLRE